MKVPTQSKCEKREECCLYSGIGRIYRVKREVLSQINWDNPQWAYTKVREPDAYRGKYDRNL